MTAGVSIPIDVSGIVTSLIVAAIVGVLTLGGTLVFRLWNMPNTQRDMLEELRLMRHTFQELAHRLRPGRHS